MKVLSSPDYIHVIEKDIKNNKGLQNSISIALNDIKKRDVEYLKDYKKPDYQILETNLAFEINNNSSLSFRTRRNKERDLTEYYNLIYQYKNDCLVAGLEYKKDFYSDGSLKPDEQIFFSITIMPFGKVNSPDFKQ